MVEVQPFGHYKRRGGEAMQHGEAPQISGGEASTAPL